MPAQERAGQCAIGAKRSVKAGVPLPARTWEPPGATSSKQVAARSASAVAIRCSGTSMETTLGRRQQQSLTAINGKMRGAWPRGMCTSSDAQTPGCRKLSCATPFAVDVVSAA